MKWKKFNQNPNNLKVGDCVVKSISLALDISWFKVYDDLCKIGNSLSCMPNDIETVKIYLQNYELVTPKIRKGDKRPKVKDFNKNNIFILRIANHFTCVINNVLYDTWDCRNSAVYRYWIVKKEVDLI